MNNPLKQFMHLAALTTLAPIVNAEQDALSYRTSMTIADSYWTRPGFFAPDKEGPVIQPELNVTFSGKQGAVSGYIWENQNLAYGIGADGAHEIDIGISYTSRPFFEAGNFSAGLGLHGAWWEFGVAKILGKSHGILEPGIWIKQKINEKLSLESKLSSVKLLGDEGRDGFMVDHSATLRYSLGKRASVALSYGMMYLDGSGIYGSEAGAAYLRGSLPVQYDFGNGINASLGIRFQKGFHDKPTGIGGFLTLEKRF